MIQIIYALIIVVLTLLALYLLGRVVAQFVGLLQSIAIAKALKKSGINLQDIAEKSLEVFDDDFFKRLRH